MNATIYNGDAFLPEEPRGDSLGKTDSGAEGDGAKRCLFARRAEGDSLGKTDSNEHRELECPKDTLRAVSKIRAAHKKNPDMPSRI